MTHKTYSNFKKVLYVSLMQMLYQSIANSIMGIMSQLTEQNNIWWAGPTTTMIIFIFSGVGSFYNKYIGKYKYRYTFLVGSFGYIFYNASAIVFVLNHKANFTLLMIGISVVNVIGGLIMSMFYISQFNYVSECSLADNRSMYFGINMGIVQSANIFGNLLSAYTVQPLGQKNYCIMMTILIIVISATFLFVYEVQKKQPQTEVQKQAQVQIQIQQLKVDENGSNSEQQITARQCSSSNTRHQKNIYRVVPSFALLGMTVAFVYTFFSVLMIRMYGDDMTDIELNQLTFKLFMFEGFGEFIGGLFYSFYAQKISKKVFLITTNKILTVCILLIITSYYTKSIYILGLGFTIIGFVDCCSYALNLALVSEQNWGKRGYTIMNVSQNSGVTVTILMMMFASTEWFFVYSLGIQIVASVFLHNYKSLKNCTPNLNSKTQSQKQQI